MLIDEDLRVRHALKQMDAAIAVLYQAIDATIFDFIKDCRLERRDCRHEIARRHGKGQHYSQAVLLYRVHRANIDLSWSRIWYLRGSNIPRYKRIPCSKGAVHLARLRSKAHPDEVDLILRHEAQARAYRELNARIKKIWNEKDRLAARFDVLTGTGNLLRRKDDEAR